MVAWLLCAVVLAQALNPRLAAAQPARGEAPAPSAPPPMKDEARLHYERGLALYAAKDYAAAVIELEAGHAIDPRREFLFAEAQAKRLLGDCSAAVPLYQKFLETEPPPAQVNATQTGLARCAQQMAARPPPPAPDAQTPTLAPPQTESPPRPPEKPAAAVVSLPPPAPPAWYRDPLGATLLGAGVVGLGVGSAFLVASFSARGSASSTYPEYERHWQTAEARWNVAMVGLIAGGLLTGAAITRYLLRGRF